MLNTELSEARRRTTALAYGLACHSLFTVAIVCAALAMYHGMHFGPVEMSAPFNWIWDLLLLAQFPLLHSFLLTRKGGKHLNRLGPERLGSALSTTTFTIIASLQMMALYFLWSPVGSIWWEARGVSKVLISLVYLACWLFLGKAMADAGLKTQTGYLGWNAVFRGRKPVYEPMPVQGTFRLCRQPVYLAFALTTWTVPTWSPDQLVLAFWFTAYCLLGPILKEKRYSSRYGTDFQRYRERVPYIIPGLGR